MQSRARSLLQTILAGLFLLAATASACHAQDSAVVWGKPRDISGPADVNTEGDLVYALNLGVASADRGTATTVNGVAFIGASTNPHRSTSGWFSTTAANFSRYSSGMAPFAALPEEYHALLLTGIRTDDTDGAFGNFDITLKGLAVGARYTVQIWLNDSRTSSGAFARAVSVATVSTFDGSPVALDANVANAGGALGQHVLGAFTATAATQTITFTSLTTDGAGALVNALQLRRVGGAR